MQLIVQDSPLKRSSRKRDIIDSCVKYGHSWKDFDLSLNEVREGNSRNDSYVLKAEDGSIKSYFELVDDIQTIEDFILYKEKFDSSNSTWIKILKRKIETVDRKDISNLRKLFDEKYEWRSVLDILIKHFYL